MVFWWVNWFLSVNQVYERWNLSTNKRTNKSFKNQIFEQSSFLKKNFIENK